MMNWFSKARTFLREVRAEMGKVSFPSRNEVVGTTIVVLITSVIFAVYLGISDVLIQRGYKLLVEMLGS